MLPALCFGLVLLFQLPPVLAVGMLLLAASPGGTTANLYSHLFRGDVALNISLTAINSVLAVFTLPLITNLAIAYFLPGDESLGLQPAKVLEVFAIVLGPVVLGMLVRWWRSGFADRMDRPVRIASVVILVVVIAGAIVANLELLARERGPARRHHRGLLRAEPHDRLPGAPDAPGRPPAVDRELVRDRHPQRDARDRDRPDGGRQRRDEPPAAVYGVLMFFIALAFGFLIRGRARVRTRTPRRRRRGGQSAMQAAGRGRATDAAEATRAEP